MRKGSHKVVTIPEANPEMKPSTAPHGIQSTVEFIDRTWERDDGLGRADTELNQLISGKTNPRFIAAEVNSPTETKDILLRICDACHGIDGRIEPWAGIRHDIERLK